MGEEGRDLVHHIVRNTKRYVILFSRAIDALLPMPSIPVRIPTDMPRSLLRIRRRV